MTDVIILAGGLGSRLRGVLNKTPKAMAPVRGTPFITYILDWVASQRASRVILAVSHLRSAIIDFVGSSWGDIPIAWSVEDIPLGTGGAVRLAVEQSNADTVVIINGDTWFPVDLHGLMRYHRARESSITLAAARVDDTSRYGALEVDDTGVISRFVEKGCSGDGLINGGVYAINRQVLNAWRAGDAFSLEHDIFQSSMFADCIHAWTSDAPFLDIGVPEDLQRADSLIPHREVHR